MEESLSRIVQENNAITIRGMTQKLENEHNIEISCLKMSKMLKILNITRKSLKLRPVIVLCNLLIEKRK